MSNEYKPPLAVHFIWHPSDSNAVDPILTNIRTNFARDKDKPFSRGLNIPLFFYSSLNSSQVPDDAPAEVADRNVIFVFTSVNTAGQTNWTGYIESLSATPGARIVPVAIDSHGLGHSGGLSGLNCVRAYDWPNENKDLHSIVALAHEIYRHGFVEIDPEDKGQDSSIKIFLSHAKAGGTGRRHAEAIKGFIDNTNMSRFFDATEISPGFRFDEEIKRHIDESTFVAIESDAYSSRYWCQREVLRAKEARRPILAVDCLEEFEDRVFPAASNIPCVHVPPDEALSEKDILRVLASALLETIRHEHAIKSIQYYQSQGWVSPDSEISSRPLEVRHALLAKEDGKTEVCYPEPPVYTEEVDWQEKIGITSFTPLWKPSEKDQLKGLRVGISISDPPLQGYASYHLHSEHLMRLAQDVARHLVARAADLIYGGDLRMDGFTEFILEEASILKSRLQSDTAHVENHLAWPLYLDSGDGGYERITTWRARFRDVMTTKECDIPDDIIDLVDQEIFLRPTSTLNRYVWSRCLTLMREESISNSDARICVGGKLSGYQGKMPGVLEEVVISLETEKPIYLLGAFDGVVGEVCKTIVDGSISPTLTEEWQITHNDGYSDLQKHAKKHMKHADYQQLKAILEGVRIADLAKKAGLIEEDYLRLMRSPFVDECVHLILKGLGKIAVTIDGWGG